MKLFFLLLLGGLPLHGFAADTADAISEAWHSQNARQELGFIVYSYFEYNSVSPSASDDNPSQEGDDFSKDLQAFLDGRGMASDCAVAHALWFDLGDGATGDIENEIMDRGPRMLPILTYGLEELQQIPDDGDEDCGIVRLRHAAVQSLYQECVQGIRGDLQKRLL